HGRPLDATASRLQTRSRATCESGLATRRRGGRGSSGSSACRDDDDPAVLACHCPLWRVSGPQKRWPPGVENPVARMAAYPNTAGRCSSCTFPFSIKLVIKSQAIDKGTPRVSRVDRGICLDEVSHFSFTRCFMLPTK